MYSKIPTKKGLMKLINGCFERSMNGKRMPSDTPEMKAMLTYMQWLSQGVPVGAKIEG